MTVSRMYCGQATDRNRGSDIPVDCDGRSCSEPLRPSQATAVDRPMMTYDELDVEKNTGSDGGK